MILEQVWMSCIMYRLGQTNGWTYIGMPTVICDAGAKMRVRRGKNDPGIPDTVKRPTAGLDLIREVLDTRRKSYRNYLPGWQSTEDAQLFAQLKRSTENGLHTGFVMFVNGTPANEPTDELAQDYVMPEGPSDSFPVVNTLFTQIPRDGDHNSVMITTVDQNRDNVRAKGICKVLQGFTLYLCLMAKNFLLEGKTETRYSDLLIVCNVMPSNGPVDIEGLQCRKSSIISRIADAEV